APGASADRSSGTLISSLWPTDDDNEPDVSENLPAPTLMFRGHSGSPSRSNRRPGTGGYRRGLACGLLGVSTIDPSEWHSAKAKCVSRRLVPEGRPRLSSARVRRYLIELRCMNNRSAVCAYFSPVSITP